MSDIATPRYNVHELQAALEFFEKKQRAVSVMIKPGERGQLSLSHNERDGASTTITLYRIDGETQDATRMAEKTTVERFVYVSTKV